MNLERALLPLLSVEGLIAVLLLTREGLPVDMIGHGLKAEEMAAEVAGIAVGAQSGFLRLGMGHPDHMSVRLPDCQLVVFWLPRFLLAAVLEPDAKPDLVTLIDSDIKGPLLQAVGGEW